MFVQIFRTDTVFVMVNVNHIIFLEPLKHNNGCRVILSSGNGFDSIESYETIIENIRIIQI